MEAPRGCFQAETNTDRVLNMISVDFYGLKTHLSCHVSRFALSNLLRLGQFESGEQAQIVGDNGAPYVLFEPGPTRPGTPSKTKGSLQCRNVGFNARAKVLQPLVDPVAFNHLQNRKPLALGKGHVPYPIFQAQGAFGSGDG